MIVGKTHHRERRHGIRFAGFALGDELLEFCQPFAKAGVAPAVGVRIVLRHGRVCSLRRSERRLVAIHRHAVGSGEVEAPETGTVMVCERSLVGNVANGIGDVGILFVALLFGSLDVVCGNHGDKFAVIPVGQSGARGGIPEIKSFRLAQIQESLAIRKMLFEHIS